MIWLACTPRARVVVQKDAPPRPSAEADGARENLPQPETDQ